MEFTNTTQILIQYVYEGIQYYIVSRDNKIYAVCYDDKKVRVNFKDNEKDILKFLNIRLLTSIMLFFVVLYFVDWGYILSPVLVVLYYIFLPNITIDREIKKRKVKLESEAMYFFEILSLSLESAKYHFCCRKRW